MKALIIADTDSPVRKITDYITPYGFDVIRYRSATKAIDNIEEIGPDAVFISAGDFPRHWKTIVQFIRSDTGKDRTIIILLINERFTSDDADKATHIGVQAIVNEKFSGLNDEKLLLEIFTRYRHLGTGGQPDTREALQHIRSKATFLFTNPVSETIITGKVENLSRDEIMFKPDAPSMTADLAQGDIIDQCSLKLDEKIVSPKCRIRKNGNLLVLEITGSDAKLADEINAFTAATK